jgi:hypothetical protein
MKTLLYIMSLCTSYIFLSVQFDVLAQSSSPAATRAYCDNNRNISVQMAVQNISTNLQPMVSQEVERVSKSFVTNAYPVPVPVTNTVYVETVVSNQIIYQTTQTEVYATYAFMTNIYVNSTTNIYVTETTNITTDIDFSTNIIQQIGTNAILPNTEGSNFNFMVSDNRGYDMLLSTNSSGMNMVFGRTYNDFKGLHPHYMQSTNIPPSYIPDIIYYIDIHKVNSTSYDNRHYGFTRQNDSLYIGKNIFNHSTFSSRFASSNDTENIYDSVIGYSNDVDEVLIYATNRNFIIGNDVSPLIDISEITMREFGGVKDFCIDGSVIISSDMDTTNINTASESYISRTKQFAGFKNCIVLDAIDNNFDGYLSVGRLGSGERLRNKICLSVKQGIDDIMILRRKYSIDGVDTYDSLSTIIGQMVTNIVNQMRPQ